MLVPFRKIREGACPPERATDGVVGYDVYASRVLDKKSKIVTSELPYMLEAGASVLIGIDVQIAIPWPYKMGVYPRSGLATVHDVELSNSPGTVDPDFRGEVGILLRNRGLNTFVIEPNMRVAQLIFSEVRAPVLQEVSELPPTRRGAGGFGSTGLMAITGGTADSLALQLRLDRYFMKIAIATSELSTCIRGMRETGKQTRRFGCVIVKNGSVISSGYNAFYPGQTECTAQECIREQTHSQSGMGLEQGGCSHAEWMAISNLLKSGVGVSTQGSSVYVNAEPCKICAKWLALIEPNEVVIPQGVYSNNGVPILQNSGVIVRHISMEDS